MKIVLKLDAEAGDLRGEDHGECSASRIAIENRRTAEIVLERQAASAGAFRYVEQTAVGCGAPQNSLPGAIDDRLVDGSIEPPSTNAPHHGGRDHHRA